MTTNNSAEARFDLKELAQIVGYLLIAYIGRGNASELREWLQQGPPAHVEERLRAAFEIAKPIAEAESEYAAQWFLWGNLEAIPTAESPATLLRETADIPATRAALMEAARKEYLQNVAADLEDVERRLREWIAGARMPAGTAYKTGIHSERLWLKLLHAGFSLEQQSAWDRGEEWPLWPELIAAVPEMAVSRVAPNIDNGRPYRYLRRAGK